MSKFLSLIEENTPQDTREANEFTKEWLEQLEGYMAQVELNLSYAGELLVEINDPFVEKRAGELGAMIQEDLHNFMDNFGGTSVEDAEDGDEAPAEDSELEVDDGKVEQAQRALKAAEAITGTKDARAGMMGRDPKKNVERAVGKLYNKVAKHLKDFTKEF